MGASYKDVGKCIVGTGVLDCPLARKFNPQKTKRIPRQIFESLSGCLY